MWCWLVPAVLAHVAREHTKNRERLDHSEHRPVEVQIGATGVAGRVNSSLPKGVSLLQEAAEELDIRPYRDGDDDRREMQARGFDLAWVPSTLVGRDGPGPGPGAAEARKAGDADADAEPRDSAQRSAAPSGAAPDSKERGDEEGRARGHDGDGVAEDFQNSAFVSESETVDGMATTTERDRPLAREQSDKRETRDREKVERSHRSRDRGSRERGSHRLPRGDVDDDDAEDPYPYKMDLTTDPYTGEPCREPREGTLDISSEFFECRTEDYGDAPDWTSTSNGEGTERAVAPVELVNQWKLNACQGHFNLKDMVSEDGGMTCNAYAKAGFCVNPKHNGGHYRDVFCVDETKSSSTFSVPEENCCLCGRGRKTLVKPMSYCIEKGFIDKPRIKTTEKQQPTTVQQVFTATDSGPSNRMTSWAVLVVVVVVALASGYTAGFGRPPAHFADGLEKLEK